MAKDATSQLDPARSSAWRSLSSAQAVLSAHLEEALVEAQLPPAGWLGVLIALDDAGPDARLRPRDLGCHVVLTKSGLTRLLDRMVESGLVERRACDTDRRGNWIVLTPVGEATLARMRPVYERALAESFGTELRPDEVETLFRLLERARPAPPDEADSAEAE